MIPRLADLPETALKGKRVLVRVDFNIENPADGFRERAILPTLEYLLKAKARVVLLSHRSRPHRQETNFTKPVAAVKQSESLKPFLPFLKRHVRREAMFLNRIPAKLPPRGTLFLIENLRLWTGEEKNDAGFARALAALGDLYVNDAFAVAHRKNASVVAITRFLPSYAGLLLTRELEGLAASLSPARRPFLIILGGGKLDDKIRIMRRLEAKAGKIILGSAILNDPSLIDITSPKIMVPVDFIGEGETALDIGPLTAAEIEEEIKHAKTVIWNGPVGQFEVPRYSMGSKRIAYCIAHSRVYSVVGGGETTQLITDMKLEDKIDFLSTGGGAMLTFLAGEKLPAVEAMKNASH